MRPYLTLTAFAVALTTATPALAQIAPPPAPPPLPLVTEVSDTRAREALVRRYFVAVQFDKLMNGMIEVMIENTLADPRIPPDKREIVQNVAMESFAAVMPGYMDLVVEVYAEEFTREELTQLVNFYESPIGRTLTAKSVVLSRRTGELMSYFQPAFEADMQRRLCDRIGCGPESNPMARR